MKRAVWRAPVPRADSSSSQGICVLYRRDPFLPRRLSKFVRSGRVSKVGIPSKNFQRVYLRLAVWLQCLDKSGSTREAPKSCGTFILNYFTLRTFAASWRDRSNIVDFDLFEDARFILTQITTSAPSAPRTRLVSPTSGLRRLYRCQPFHPLPRRSRR
jgi:hypothetical protein